MPEASAAESVPPKSERAWSISGRALAANTAWNVAGTFLPLAVGLVSVPLVLRYMGTERLGVLTLIWTVLGYSTLFDAGLGRALTKLVAENVEEPDARLGNLIGTGLVLMLIGGVAGGILLAAVTPFLVRLGMKSTVELTPEVARSFYLLSLCFPVVVLTAGLKGVLEALQRFRLLNAIRIPMGVFNFLSPLLVLPFTRRVDAVVLILVVVRAIGLFAHWWGCRRALPVAFTHLAFIRSEVKPLLSFGGWLTVSNTLSPLLAGFDRFAVGFLLSVAAVAWYASPFEMVIRLALLPVALLGTLFPALASSYARDRTRAAWLYERGMKHMAVALIPPVILIILFAQEALSVWLGPEFAGHSFRVLQWLAFGVFVNGLAQVPFGLIHATGRPDFTAKTHMIEVPIYLAVLWWLVQHYGVTGAAIAWSVRTLADGAVLIFFSSHALYGASRKAGDWLSTIGGVAILCLAAATPMPGATKVMVAAAFILAFGAVAWKVIFDERERELTLHALRRPFSKTPSA